MNSTEQGPVRKALGAATAVAVITVAADLTPPTIDPPNVLAPGMGVQRDQGRSQVRSVDRHTTAVGATQRFPFHLFRSQGRNIFTPQRAL